MNNLEKLNQVILEFLNDTNLKAVEEGEMKPLMSKTIAMYIYNRMDVLKDNSNLIKEL